MKKIVKIVMGICIAIYFILSNTIFVEETLEDLFFEKPICDSGFSNGMNITGFKENGVFQNINCARNLNIRNPNIKYFGSAREGDEFTGSVHSEWYYTDKNTITMKYFGDLRHEGLDLYIEFTDGTSIHAPKEKHDSEWGIWKIRLTNKSEFRICAIDNETTSWGWLAFTEPYYVNDTFINIYEQVKYITSIPLIFLVFLFFLIPGIVSTFFLNRKMNIKQYYIFPILFLTISCTLIYFFFFLSLINYLAFSITIIIVMIIFLFVFHKQYCDIKRFLNKCNFKEHIYVLAMISFFMITFSSSVVPNDGNSIGVANNIRILWSLPVDNILQYQLGERLINGEATIPFVGDWLASDRPPMSAAIYLFFRTFMPYINSEVLYQSSGIIMLCTWCWAVKCIMTFLKCKIKTINFTLLIMTINNCIIINSIYIWFKLITVCFYVLIAVSYYIMMKKDEANNTPQYFWGFIIGISAGAALECHGTIAFGILGLILSNIHKIKVKISTVVTMMGTFILIYLPWMLYQKLIDPPGDRLLKWYFAGLVAPHPEISPIDAILSAYSSTDISTIIYNKLQNLKVYFYIRPNLSLYQSDFKILFYTLGFIILAVLNLFNKKASIRIGYVDRKKYFYLLRAWIFSLVITAMMFFAPGETIIHQSSYSNLLLGFILFAALLEGGGKTSKTLGITIFLGTVLKFFKGNVTIAFFSNNIINPLITALCIILLGLLVFILLYNSKHNICSINSQNKQV